MGSGTKSGKNASLGYQHKLLKSSTNFALNLKITFHSYIKVSRLKHHWDGVLPHSSPSNSEDDLLYSSLSMPSEV